MRMTMQEADSKRSRQSGGTIRDAVDTKREMAIRQLTSCLMASYVLLSTGVREATAQPGSRPPHVRAQYPSSLVAQLGSSVRITCPVDGDPRPLVSWTKDSDIVHIGWRRFRLHRPGTWLFITDVQATDAGRYTCKATNGFGTAIVTVNLFVVPNTNNASLYDASDVISGLPVTSSAADQTTQYIGDIVTPWNVTVDVVGAKVDDVRDGDDDVILTSLLCVGAAVCSTSLGVLIILVLRRRLRDEALGEDKQVVVPLSAAQRLLAIAAAAAAAGKTTSVPTGNRVDGGAEQLDVGRAIRRENGPPTTLYRDNWTASHVTAMKLLITSNRRQLSASSTDTCFV